MLAVLAVIGGVDSRLRLGGLAQQNELGVGTVARLHTKARAIVVFSGHRKPKLCPLHQIKPVSLY